MAYRRRLWSWTGLIFAVALAVMMWRWSQTTNRAAITPPAQPAEADAPTLLAQAPNPDPCEITKRVVTVRGHSLGNLAAPGTELSALFGYYACHTVQRGDLIWLRIAGGEQSAAKIVKAVPGDRLAIAEIDGQPRLLINDKPPLTSTGEHYYLDRRARRLLEIYQGPLPKDAYLVLADRNQRVVDARRFGLVHRDQILARLEPADN